MTSSVISSSDPKAFMFGWIVLASLHWGLFTSESQNAEEKEFGKPYLPWARIINPYAGGHYSSFSLPFITLTVQKDTIEPKFPSVSI